MKQMDDLRKRFRSQLDYSIALARIVEALCYGHDIPESCDKLAPYHAQMARERMKEDKNRYLKYKY